MKFSKIRNVKSPVRSTAGSAGIDFFIPEDFKKTVLTPGEDILIPSGIRANVPEGYMLIGADKSGIATSDTAKARLSISCKLPASALIVGAKVIDSDYQGEIHIHIINVGLCDAELLPGMKIAQFILVPVNMEALEECSEDELFSKSTARGAGGFGSTTSTSEF